MADHMLRLGLSHLPPFSFLFFPLILSFSGVEGVCEWTVAAVLGSVCEWTVGMDSASVFLPSSYASNHEQRHSSLLIPLAGPVKQHTLKDGVTLKCC